MLRRNWSYRAASRTWTELVEAQMISLSCSMPIAGPEASEERCSPSLHFPFAMLRMCSSRVVASLFAEPRTENWTEQPRDKGQRVSSTMDTSALGLEPLTL